MEITWGWDLVLILGILALIVCVFSFDMIDNWQNKRRSDMNLLLLSVSLYSLFILLGSELNLPSKIVIGTALIVLATMGHVATTKNFSDDAANASDKPWELWFVAFFTLTVLVGSVLWLYLYTDVGRAAQKSASKLSSRLKQFKMKRKGKGKTRTNNIEMQEMMESQF